MTEPLADAEVEIDGDHLELCWLPDGRCDFYPSTTDPERLAKRLALIVDALYQNPAAILHAAGVHDGAAP